MACPKCGLPALPEQRFCRSCGTSLQVTTNPLEERVPFAAPEIASTITVKGETNRANRFTLWGFIAILVGVAIGVIGKKLIEDQLIAVIGILISLVGMFLMVYPHLAPSTRRRLYDRPSPQPEQLTQSQPIKALESESTIEYVPSITERTTNLLTNSAPSRPKQEEGSDSPHRTP